MDTSKMSKEKTTLTKEELQKSLKNEKQFINEVMNKYKDMDREGINGIFKKEIEEILNYNLRLTYDVMKRLNKNLPYFKLLFLNHEKIYCFMLKNKLKVDIKWEEDDFLKSLEYPLKNLEL